MIRETGAVITEHPLSRGKRDLQAQRLAHRVRLRLRWEIPVDPTHVHDGTRTLKCRSLIDGSLLIRALDPESGTIALVKTHGKRHGVDNPSNIVIAIPDKTPLCDSEEALVLANKTISAALKASK